MASRRLPTAGTMDAAETTGTSARSSHDAPLVGRAWELAGLRACLRAALAGEARLALIGGEAGIGKTTLARALGREAAAGGALVLEGRCYDLAETPPYGLWLDLLDCYRPADGLPPPPDGLRRAGAGEGVASQAALFAEARDFFAAVAARRPLVLVLDDLHWADPASLDLLRTLAQRLAALPLLLVVIYRAEEVTRGRPLYALLPALAREADAARFDLRPLDDTAVLALLWARYGALGAGETPLVAYLQHRSEGNPFFIGELLRTLEDEGLVERLPEGGWGVGDLARARVPPFLRQVIDGRLARLGEEGRGLLAIAAVIGQEAPLALWAAVGEAAEEAVLDLAERAVEAHLLEATPDGDGVRFAHALIREALYEGLLPPRRRAWHRRVGEALAAGPAPDPDAVASHFQRAGDDRAVEWLVRAGTRARRAYALLTAAERFEAALALMEARGADPAARGWLLLRLARVRRVGDPRAGLAALAEAMRLGTAAGDHALVAQCRVNQGLSHCLAGDLRPGLAELAEGIAAHAALGPADRERLRAVPVAGSVAYGDRDYRGTLALWLMWAGRFAEAEALAATSIPGASGYDAAQATLTVVHAAFGRPAAARLACARTLAAYRAVGDHHSAMWTLIIELDWIVLPYESDHPVTRYPLVAAAEAEWETARVAYAAPSPDEPRLPLLLLEGHWARARAALEALHAERDAWWRAQVALWLGPLARAQGDADLARSLVREWLPDGPDTEPGGMYYLCALALQRLAAALVLDASDLAAARAWLEAHDRWLAWGDAVLGRAEGALGWAEYHRAAGDLALAQAHAAHALAHAAEPRQPLALLAAHRLLGELDTAAGDHAGAATHLAAALALADACAAPYERALTLLAQAELRAATGEREAAGVALTEARAILEPLGARPALARADALAATLARGPAARPAYPAGLTAREVEVLRLVARGLTDAQVAERLFLSPRTIGRHLTSVYNKLGVSSRLAATRFAIDHQLA